MTTDGRGQPTVVDVGACRCPGTPHASDTVTLFDEAPMDLGIAMYALVGQEEQVELGQARLVHLYQRLGIKAWSFVDEHGLAVPVNEENARRLIPFSRGGLELWNAADDIYTRVYDPLVAQRLRRSASTSTESETSASPPTSPSPPTPSGPSSLTGSADGTVSETRVQ